MTWNSGWRDGDRCRGQLLDQPLERHVLVVQRAQPVSRTRPSSSANAGSPDRSVRSTRVLTKNPTRSSSASSVRPATGGADRDVGPRAPSRDSSTASAGLQHHEQRHALLAGQRGQPPRAASAPGRQRHRVRRGGWRPAGRGRSAGSASSGGAPASACRQYATWPASRLPGSSSSPSSSALPQRVVRVLHRQRLPARRPPAPPRRVRRRSVRAAAGPSTSRRRRCDGSPAPARARPGPRPAAAPAPGPRGGQVERLAAGDRRDPAARLRLAHRAGDRQLPGQLVRDASTCWYGSAVHRGEHRAQHLVPADHVGQRRRQRRPVQSPASRSATGML